MTLIDYRTWACQREEHTGCYAILKPGFLPWWLCACECHRKEKSA